MDNIRKVGNFEVNSSIGVHYEAIFELRKSVAYFMGEGRTTRVLADNLDDMLAAVELLALTAEYCKISPRIYPATVRRWLDTYLRAFDERVGADPTPDELEDRKMSIVAFEHLEKVAQKYPPVKWIAEVED